MSVSVVFGLVCLLSGFIAMGWAVLGDVRTGGFQRGLPRGTSESAAARYALAIALLLIGSALLGWL